MLRSALSVAVSFQERWSLAGESLAMLYSLTTYDLFLGGCSVFAIQNLMQTQSLSQKHAYLT